MDEWQIPEQETLVEWLERCPNFMDVGGGIFDRLANRPEMDSVWKWHADIASGVLESQLALAIRIQQATQFPDKPGNMAPREREKYFQKVRRHTSALIELLTGTRYDGEWVSRQIPREKLAQTVEQDVQVWSHEEAPDEHVIAYLVTHDGIYDLVWDYPTPRVVELLNSVIEWTEYEDNWSRDPFISSRPIAQGSNSITPAFFNRTLHETLSRIGLDIPFPILATICNVALDVPSGELIDEEVVRKQVRRHQTRG